MADTPRTGFAYDHDFALGCARFIRGELGQAADHFRRAAAADPSRSEATANLGLIENMRCGAETDPSSLHLPKSLMGPLLAGAMSMPDSERDEAERRFALCKSRWPDSMEIIAATARLLNRDLRFAEIVDLLGPVPAESLDDWELHHILGTALMHLDRGAEAMAPVRRGAAMAPLGMAHAIFQPVWALIALGDTAAAEEEFAASRGFATRSTQRECCLGAIRLAQNALEDAEAAFRTAIDLAEGCRFNNPTTLLGLTLSKAGRHGEALDWLAKAIEIARDPFAMGNLSIGLFASGDLESGRFWRLQAETEFGWAMPLHDRFRAGLGFGCGRTG